MPEQSHSPETGLFGKGVAVESGAVQAGGQVLVFDTPPEGEVGVERAKTKVLGLFGWLAIIWMVVVVSCAVLAPILPIPAPDQHFLRDIGEGPSLSHPMGTDGTGQDLLARVIWGARASLVVAVSAVLFGLIFGGILGLIVGLLPRQARHGPREHLQRVPRHPATRARTCARRSVRERSRRVGGQARVLADHLDRRRVDPDHRPHHAGQHARVGAAGVRARRAEHGRQEPSHHHPRRAAQRAAGDVLDRAPRHRGRHRARGRLEHPRRRRAAIHTVVGQHRSPPGATSSPRSRRAIRRSSSRPPSPSSSRCCRSTTSATSSAPASTSGRRRSDVRLSRRPRRRRRVDVRTAQAGQSHDPAQRAGAPARGHRPPHVRSRPPRAW